MQYKYEVRPSASRSVWIFYRHVALKYRHTFDTEDIVRNAQRVIQNMGRIEQSLLRRRPTLKRWQDQGWHMAHAGHWYYAYTINEDTVTIEDARHEQNMHEDK